MKLIPLILFCSIAFSSQAQSSEIDYLKKCQSLDSILETLYGVISNTVYELRVLLRLVAALDISFGFESDF